MTVRTLADLLAWLRTYRIAPWWAKPGAVSGEAMHPYKCRRCGAHHLGH